MTDGFVYEAQPMRVVFGAGSTAVLPAEAERLGMRRALVLSTPQQRGLATRVAALLGERAAGVFDGARMHVPVETVAAAEAAVAEADADGCVAVGGGSTVGLGKALALRRALPVLALPTTYAGSEMTPIWGLTENAEKRTGRDPAVMPRSVVYDPDLTMTLPAAVSVTSGINALAHAVEALYAPDGSPVVAAMAERGVRDLANALPLLADDPGDRAGRRAALCGAWLCGACLGATTMGLHHKLCHVLGGMFDLPHAETHAIVLPHVAALNLPAAPEADAALRRVLDTDDVPAALAKLTALATRLGAPGGLQELGVAEDDLPRVADEVLARPYANPWPVGRRDLLGLLHAAHRGGTS
ncbi:maleylacetate reductase [Streptosporangium saharense]|uniref:Maleylacetate reductase n=1 Tax=Streptosporangium saharense TaxID=1706840 RepID=A0A7W7VP70_9ACTN|nr:maleylacetate reductase [Streptosporangium saharense]MBB4917204.1 maleylacetate reductase [Streptosporangium saharense]